MADLIKELIAIANQIESDRDMRRIMSHIQVLKDQIHMDWKEFTVDLNYTPPFPTLGEILDATMTVIDQEEHIEDIMYEILNQRKGK